MKAYSNKFFDVLIHEEWDNKNQAIYQVIYDPIWLIHIIDFKQRNSALTNYELTDKSFFFHM